MRFQYNFPGLQSQINWWERLFTCYIEGEGKSWRSSNDHNGVKIWRKKWIMTVSLHYRNNGELIMREEIRLQHATPSCFWPQGHWVSCNEIEFLGPFKHTVELKYSGKRYSWGCFNKNPWKIYLEEFSVFM